MGHKTQNIKLVFIGKELYVSAYEANKRYPLFSDIGFYYQKTNKDFEIQVRTNIGWDKATAKTSEEAKEKLIELYEAYQNRYQYHLASLFKTHKPKNIKVSILKA